MNKRKKVAIMKHRIKRKKLEEKRKALIMASGGAGKQAVKVAPKKEKEVMKPVNAFSSLLKAKEEAPAKKAPIKKEKEEAVKAVAAPEKDEKAKKPAVKKKKTEEPKAAEAKTETSKKPAVKKKKTSEEAG